MTRLRPLLLALTVAGVLAGSSAGGQVAGDADDAEEEGAATAAADDVRPVPTAGAEPLGTRPGDAGRAIGGIKAAPEAIEAPPAEAAAPVTVAVPSLGIDSDLVRLGLNDDGTMEVPADFDLAGWYVHGPKPGQMGPAVIAGHVDSVDGPAVFHRLGELSEGDRIEVARADGSVAVFAVDAVEQHPKDAFPTASVYGDLDHSGLRLITCTGDFDRPAGRYLDNLVVYASLVDA